MQSAVSVINGWPVSMDGDEPRILDEELGARLGFARPRKIRELIRTMIASEILNDYDTCPRHGRVATGKASMPIVQYHLTETGALLVITRSNTKIAHAVTRQIVEVFKAARRGQFALPQQVPVLSTSPLVSDSSIHRAEMASWCELAARNNNVSVHRIHGALRRQCGVPSVYRIPLVLFPQAVDLAKALARGSLLLPAAGQRKPKSVASDPQCVLPFRETRNDNRTKTN